MIDLLPLVLTYNKMYKKIIVLVCCILSINCKESNRTEINEQPVEISYPMVIELDEGLRNTDYEFVLSDIADSMRFIKLETDDSILFGRIEKVEVDGDDIFVSSYIGQKESYYFRFNSNGEFKNRVGNIGRGPGEYLGSYFSLDRQNNRIIVFRYLNLNDFIAFSYDGEFLGKTEFLPVTYDGSLFSILHGGRLVTLQGFAGRASQVPDDISTFRLYDSIGNITSSLPSRLIEYMKTEGSGQGIVSTNGGAITPWDTEAFLFSQFDDTVYSTHEDSIIPAFILEKGGYKPSIDEIFKPGLRMGQENRLWDFSPFVIRVKDKVFLRQLLNNELYLFEFNISDKSVRTTRSRLRQNFMMGIPFEELPGFVDDVSGSGRRLFYALVTGEGGRIAYCVYSANEFKKFFEKTDTNSYSTIDLASAQSREQALLMTKVEDNPVIVLVYLKK